ncbi:MAG TPA: hypothetical protein VN043_14885 [Rhodanobacter sp.]|nr:hypothetical protein [Rhodanobacter sp.]
MQTGHEFVVLGNEHDEVLRECVMRVLQSLGGSVVDRSTGIGGSQEIETLKVDLHGDMLVVEAETFVGLGISGPTRLVQKIARLVESDMRSATNGNETQA